MVTLLDKHTAHTHTKQDCQYLASRMYSIIISSNILHQWILESASHFTKFAQHVKPCSMCPCFRLELLHLALWLTRSCCDASSCRQFRPISSSLSTEVPSGQECDKGPLPPDQQTKWPHLPRTKYHVRAQETELLNPGIRVELSLYKGVELSITIYSYKSWNWTFIWAAKSPQSSLEEPYLKTDDKQIKGTPLKLLPNMRLTTSEVPVARTPDFTSTDWKSIKSS